MAILSFAPYDDIIMRIPAIGDGSLLYPSWRFTIGDSLPDDLVTKDKESISWNRVDFILVADWRLKWHFPSNCLHVPTSSRADLAQMVHDTYEARAIDRRARGRPEIGASVCIVIAGNFSSDFRRNYWYDQVLSPDFDALLLSYDRVLRTDPETVVTPFLRTWRPTTPVVARRFGHPDPFTNTMLKEMSAKLGLKHRGIHYVGSTWFMEPELLIQCRTLLRAVASYLLKHESVLEARNQYLSWFPAIYAGEIVVNHLLQGVQVSPVLDAPTDSLTDSILGVPQLHCWVNPLPLSELWAPTGSCSQYWKHNFDDWPKHWEGWWANRAARGYTFFVAQPHRHPLSYPQPDSGSLEQT
jgi:hypothetical protein